MFLLFQLYVYIYVVLRRRAWLNMQYIDLRFRPGSIDELGQKHWAPVNSSV